MTGGRVVILGSTGRNFAAGMSGGIAYIWDPQRRFAGNCNGEMVDLDPMETDADISELRQLIENHFAFTDSPVAATVLANWTESLEQFIKVMPRDYKRVLQQQAQQVSAG